MGTWYNFTTTFIDSAELAKELEDKLKQEKQTNPDHFDYTRMQFRNRVYFVGCSKNLGGGFYDWPGLSMEIDMVWISDEGSHGNY